MSKGDNIKAESLLTGKIEKLVQLLKENGIRRAKLVYLSRYCEFVLMYDYKIWKKLRNLPIPVSLEGIRQLPTDLKDKAIELFKEDNIEIYKLDAEEI